MMNSRNITTSHAGFTLIEMSIVLVIIGLVIGSILVGQSLITAAEARAQISQIEKYNTAMNTFKGKYEDYYPGDMPAADATKFGLSAGSGAQYHGDGDGFIEECGSDTYSFALGCETMLFWAQLAEAGLIDGSFNLANGTIAPDTDMPTLGGGVTLDTFLPHAKIGSGYVATFFSFQMGASAWSQINYFTVSGINNAPASSFYQSNNNVLPSQAYNIDQKVDDGLPYSGKIQTFDTTNSGSVGFFNTQSGMVSIRSFGSGFNIIRGTNALNAVCTSGSSAAGYTYNLSSDNFQCSLLFQFQ